MSPSISIAGIGKRYQVHQARARYRTLRESLTDLAAAPLRRWRHPGQGGSTQAFWALRDVTCDIHQGEVVGVIGRNGAGKSTLLKILSRITEPTTGRIELAGRVGSLLEVGTGFHPELTGRENIFLNGAILGMSRREIAGKFDEIVQFSGVEQFLETPVKRYSSGMHVRLAFAVAAHLEPEILLVDEVLAVGDAEFQRKCLGKMDSVAQSGRTVLFVSHNMAAVEGLCTRGLVLNRGELVYSGSPNDAIARYMDLAERSPDQGQFSLPPADGEHPHPPARVTKAWSESAGEFNPDGYRIGAPLLFRIQCQADRPILRPALGIGIDNAQGHRILTLHALFAQPQLSPQPVRGPFEWTCAIDGVALPAGDYHVKLSLEGEAGPLHVLQEAFAFSILRTDYYENGGRVGRGVVLCRQSWELKGSA